MGKKMTGKNFAAMMRSRHTGIAMSPAEWDEYLDNFDTIDDVKCAPNWTSGKGMQGTKGYGKDGTKFDSKWEYAYYIWKKDIKGEFIERNDHEDFIEYTDTNGKLRKFYPDFRVADGYCFTEIKGIWRDADLCKKDQCPQVRFLDGNDLKPIIQEVNKKIPNWKDSYQEIIHF